MFGLKPPKERRIGFACSPPSTRQKFKAVHPPQQPLQRAEPLQESAIAARAGLNLFHPQEARQINPADRMQRRLPPTPDHSPQEEVQAIPVLGALPSTHANSYEERRRAFIEATKQIQREPDPHEDLEEFIAEQATEQLLEVAMHHSGSGAVVEIGRNLMDEDAFSSLVVKSFECLVRSARFAR